MGLMLLRVKPTLTRFPTNSLYTPMDTTPLHFISSVCNPRGESCCLVGHGHFGLKTAAVLSSAGL